MIATFGGCFFAQIFLPFWTFPSSILSTVGAKKKCSNSLVELTITNVGRKYVCYNSSCVLIVCTPNRQQKEETVIR